MIKGRFYYHINMTSLEISDIFYVYIHCPIIKQKRDI